MNDRYHGKRFAGFLFTCMLVTAGFFGGPVEIFGAFSATMGLLYGAYLGGQSATDHKALHMNGGAKGDIGET